MEPITSVEADVPASGIGGTLISIDGISIEELITGTTTVSDAPNPTYPPEAMDDFSLDTLGTADGQQYYETRYDQAVEAVFILERGGNDAGNIQGLDEQGQLIGQAVTIQANSADFWFDTQLKPGLLPSQNLFGMVVRTDTPIYGIRVSAPGSDPTNVLGLPVVDRENASNPTPEDQATDVPCDVILGWTPGQWAATHDVYLGTVFDDVSNASRANPLGVLVSQGQAASTFDPDGLLAFDQTYYWRIDEVNAPPDSTIFKGTIWSFATEPFAYPVVGIAATTNATSKDGEGIENTINGSGLNEADEHSIDAFDMWLGLPGGAEPISIQYEFDRIYKLHEMLVWNYNVQFELVLGFGLRSVTIEYSPDGADWTALGDVEFAQATAMASYTANTTVDFAGVAAKFVRLTINSGYGPMGQFGLSEVRFLYIPAQARQPRPADGETQVAVDTTLTWRPGREAAAHDVYLATAPHALALVDTVGDTAYTPADLQFGTTYAWRIDEVNEAEAIPLWEGSLWTFLTQAFAVIDDMESYDDEDNAIFDTWLDGFVNETGSTVGYLEAPFAERTTVNGGSQSMPLQYANDAAPFYSEAEFDLDAMALSANGADTLRLFVAGRADNTAEPLYVAIEDTSGNVAVVTHPDASITTTPEWTQWLIPYADLAGVNLGRLAVMYIGLGNRDNPTAGGTGLVFIDDIGYGHPAGQ